MTVVTARRENGRRRPRGYVDWNPRRATLVLLEHVTGVLEEYAEQLPLTIRQIFYRLVGLEVIDKTENEYGRLCEHLVNARRAGKIPFDVIRDDGVTTYAVEWFDGVEDFHDETIQRARAYRRDRQAGQPQRLELWCESAGMLPQLARVADHYSVPVYSCGGFSSLTAVRQIVDRAVRRDVPTVLMHVGDYDPSGDSIFTSFTEDSAAFVRADRVIATQAIIPVRVALTAEQVEHYALPTAPPKKKDSRSKRWVGETCQLEALSPADLSQVVDNAIRRELVWSTYQREIALERDDRAELLGLPRGAS